MAGFSREGSQRRTFDCTVNGKQFIIVSYLDVVTEASEIARVLVGHDLKWFKNKLKSKFKSDEYTIKELEKPIPLWLQNKLFVGVYDSNDKNIGVVILDEEIPKTEIKQTTTPLPGVKFL